MSELYQKAILEHSRAPRHYGLLSPAARTLHGLNPLCGDEIWIYLRSVEPTVALDATFESSGCALCRASGSILLESTVGSALALLPARIAAVRTAFAAGAEPPRGEPGSVEALFDIRDYPARTRCVLLAWETLAEGLTGC